MTLAIDEMLPSSCHRCFYNINLMLYWPNIIRFSLVLVLGVLIAGVSSDSLLADTDEDHVAQSKGWKVTVSPDSFSYADEITIAMSGLPRNFPLDTSSVTLGGAKVYVSGHGEGPYARPVSDDDGILVFKTNVPDGVSSGSQYLRVEIENIFVSRTLVDVRPLTLRVSSSEIVPYQEVWVVGMGFTESPNNRGESPETINETTLGWNASSGITIGGIRVLKPYIQFPVMLGSNGSAFFKMVIPELESTITPGQVELKVTDREGRDGVAMLTVPTPKLDLANNPSYPGESVNFEISGLPASQPGFNINNVVNMTYLYAADVSGTKHIGVTIGPFAVNETGSISGRFDVPKAALLSSPNKILVVGSNGRNWELAHHLGGRSISIEPNSGFPGDPVRITIKGMPINHHLAVGSVLFGDTLMKVPGYFGEPGPRLFASDSGSLAFGSEVPTGVSVGYQTLGWNVPGGGTIGAVFYVMENRLLFDPASVTPGEIVTMTSDAHAVKTQRRSISGSGDSYVKMDNLRLAHNVVNYPVSVSADGRFETTFRVPISKGIAAKDSLEFTTVDTAGRTARGTLYLKREVITITPLESARGTRITVEGTGFFSNVSGADSSYRVLLSYGGAQIKSTILDASGAFKTSFNVPVTTDVGSENPITVELEGWPSVRVVSNHKVPEAGVQVIPDAALPGEYIELIGTGFTRFRLVTIGIGHLWVSNSDRFLKTDVSGGFRGTVEVPRGLSKGLVRLKVYAPYPIEVASVPFRVR